MFFFEGGVIFVAWEGKNPVRGVTETVRRPSYGGGERFDAGMGDFLLWV